VVELSTPVKWLLRVVVVGYVFLLVGWPVLTLVQNAFAGGLASFRAAFADPDVIHALVVTVEISLWAVIINTVFGVGMALLLVRYEFPGKRVLSALIDLPMSVSPVVIGLALLLVYNGRDGWFGPTLESHGIVVIFNSPGMIMATCFVALPLVVREVVPVLSEIGDDQEQAARSLGANAFQTLRRITLPAIKWAVVYGVVLSLARSLGEFGALKIVSGNLTGQTQTAPLVVEQKYQNFAQGEAYAVSFILVLVSVLCILVVSFLRPKESSQ
jgi:sulfate transport system permease protein